jgi:formate hydrogenlyase subunit 6/NADH:ubiquinone oxidoreductase subunit I
MKKDKIFVINKDFIIPLLRKLQKEYEIIAPVKLKGEDVVFNVITSVDEICLEYKNTLIPPKRFLFPQSEVIFKYKRLSNGDYQIQPAKFIENKRIIFGIRSCDVKGILILDKVFISGEYKDLYYQTRRENTTLISIGCTEPDINCFCLQKDTGPVLKEGFDLQLIPLNNKYTVHIGSAKGNYIIEKFGYFFQEAQAEDLEEEDKVVYEAKSKFSNRVGFYTITQKLKSGQVEEDLWEKLGEKCFVCGGCSYICPACSCFNIIDRPISEKEGIRIRSWDSCALFGFTRLASGLYPRKEKKDRIKHRFFLKLDYYSNKTSCTCVGCGRCITTCLGNIDMAEVIQMIRIES